MNKVIKTLSTDTETTGTNERLHSPIEWALSIRLNDQLVAQETFLMRPLLDIPPGADVKLLAPLPKGKERFFVTERRDGDSIKFDHFSDEKRCLTKHGVIDQDALNVQERTMEEIFTWPDPGSQLVKAKRFLNSFIDPYDRKDKLIVYGWNGAFDMRMLNSWANRLGEQYFMSYFQWPVHDVAVFFAERFRKIRHQFPNLRLGTAANFLGLQPEGALHGAMTDTRLSEKIYYLLRVMRPDDMPRSYEEGLTVKLADRLMPRVLETFGENIWELPQASATTPKPQ